MINIFVYGTLRKGERNEYLLKNPTCLAEQCWTDGCMYDTSHGYPAMKQSHSSKVFGELYSVTEAKLKKLDHLEGYEPGEENNLYERTEQTVYTDKGPTTANVYWSNQFAKQKNTDESLLLVMSSSRRHRLSGLSQSLLKVKCTFCQRLSYACHLRLSALHFSFYSEIVTSPSSLISTVV